MKRKSAGALTLRSTKRARETIYYGNIVFNVSGIIQEHIFPFLDEWGSYNLARVNKCCSVINKLTHCTHDLSNLSKHFQKEEICCICFGMLKKNRAYMTHGLYCHQLCIPEIKEWEINNLGVFSEKNHNTFGLVVRGYKYKNPCMFTNTNTLSYFIQRNYSSAYKVLLEEKNATYFKTYTRYFKEYYKRKEIELGYDMKKKVSFGGSRISVDMVFSHLYPTYYEENNPSDIIKKYKEVELRIKQVHNSARIFHATKIRPYLINSQNWGSYLKMGDVIPQHRSFLSFIFSIGGFAQPDNINKCMIENLTKSRVLQYKRAIRSNYNSWLSMTCNCSECVRLYKNITGSSTLKTIIENAARNLVHKGLVLSKTELRKLLWDKLEKANHWWCDVRNIRGVFESTINVVPFLMFVFTEELDSYCLKLETAKSLLVNGYNPFDVHSAFLNNQLIHSSYESLSGYIDALVQKRNTCYCGKKKHPYNNFCSRHRLCPACCKNKQCIEESLMDTESSSDDDSIVDLSELTTDEDDDDDVI
jgi:hypothetical protein